MVDGAVVHRASVADQDIPLCVDLDGSLLKTDVLVEGFLQLIKKNPLLVFAVCAWLLRGKAFLKAEIARRTRINIELLPVNAELLDWLQEQHGRGRRLILCTAANRQIAERIAAHHAIFEETLSSDDSTNLSGKAKAALLEERYGKGNFDYVGNEPKDMHVWFRARKAVVIAPTDSLRRRLHELPAVERVFSSTQSVGMSWIRAARLHQWAKNVLIFVPAIAAHRVFEFSTLLATVAAFLWFSLCASGTYLINDLLDLEADRAHPRKRHRPFASGELPLVQGVAIAGGLIILAIAGGIATLGVPFTTALLAYLVGTLWYSTALKRIAMVDVLALAGLYTLRVIAGGAAIAVIPSFWLLAFSMFMFLDLAIVKRYTELKAVLSAGRSTAAGRGYNTDDLSLLLSCGTSAGFTSVLVFALYINSGMGSLYARPEILWLLCPLLLYWICRTWRKAHRGELHDDPVVFALTDRPSLIVGVACLAIVWLAV